MTYIPKLVFVEGKTGKIITTEGRSIVSKDPLGEGFPWKQKTFTEIMAKGKLLDQNKKELKWEQLQGKLIGLFFSGYNVNILSLTVDYSDSGTHVVYLILTSLQRTLYTRGPKIYSLECKHVEYL